VPLVRNDSHGRLERAVEDAFRLVVGAPEPLDVRERVPKRECDRRRDGRRGKRERYAHEVDPRLLICPFDLGLLSLCRDLDGSWEVAAAAATAT